MSVVVGYVATAEGDAAFETAIAEARRRAVPLVVVVAGRASGFGPRPEADPETIAAVRERLALQADLMSELVTASRGRDVADDIVSAAVDRAAELIVIGLRRRSPVGKLLLGSNAQRILLDSPCPVLAVKPG
ncbi:universal stress protein [Actinotalea sp. M2MS4P-6]|uniref:universal stress protein n=1 Tax=Actinotalea sp. M2MS4P-6 TaxID=2983762 RepID=UPI0021E40887|nr:universal stress protein [Actinotalea sp. M2MS4P-6]MCV2396475.1 universal stress protein [Actinotalea sp. M2MS4P-6]